MNISNEISSGNQYNTSHDILSNETTAQTAAPFVYFISILMSFPLNSYVFWLIVTGTGNGLPSEFFILNLVVCEVLFCFEVPFMFLTETSLVFWIIVFLLNGLAITGQPFFECLICVERYLAVVHPVIFLKFKPLRYRLICSAVAWMAIFVTGALSGITFSFAINMYFVVLIIPYVLFLSIELFCCLAVLGVLKQSGPGQRGREEENHMKRRAFCLILVTTSSMVILYIPYITSVVLMANAYYGPFIYVGQISFTLAGLVQPVLFLYRVGKLNFKCQ